MDYNNAKIRIPNETFCPVKKIQFNTMINNNLLNVSSPINSTNFNNMTSLKSNISQNNNITSNSKANPNQNLNPNIFSQQDNSSEEGVTISPIKSIVTAASSKPPTIIEPQCKLQKFLPPKTSKYPKTLVLDLDETLIHSYFDCCSPRPPDLSYDIIIEKRKIHVNSIVRPGAIEFLESVSSIYEVVIFTASLSEYANPLVDFIDKNKKCKYRLYREHCCSFSNGFTNSFTKDLKKLDRDMKNLIIIDNNPKSYILNKENGVPIKTWVEDINDRELLRLIPYLIFLSSEKIEDVRPFLRQVNSGTILDYDKFDEIINKYKSDNFKIKKEDSSNNNLANSNNNNNNNLNNNDIAKENKKINGISNNDIDNNKDIKKLNGNILSENNINKKINTDESNIKDNNNKIIEIPNNNIISKENKKINEKINKNVEIKNKKENNNINNNKVETANKINDNKKNINNKNKPNNNTNENNIKTYKNINKNITKQKSAQIKNDNKNKSSNNISYKININNNKNYSPNRETMKINRSIDKYSNNKNDKSMKMNNNIRNINISNSINQNINNSFKNNKSNSKKKETSKKKNEKIIMRNDSINKEIQNISKRNKSVNNKNNCVNQLNNNMNDKNIKQNQNKNVLKENNCKNKRYESCMVEDDNLKIEEYALSQNKNNNKNNIIQMQREVKNMVIKSINFVNNSTQGVPTAMSVRNNARNLNNFHATKSTKNINTFKNNNMNSNNKKDIDIDNKLYDQIIIKNDLNNKEKKAFKITDIANFPPPDELLNECIINLNNANSLKSSSTSVTKNINFSEEIQEKTIINDDIDEEEKNENNAYEDLFDDIDTEKDDFNDSNLINNQKKKSQKKLKENKKKYFEADDALEYNRNIEKEKEKEILKEDKSESNTIDTKGSVKRKKRKINKNHFNKSRPYLTNNKKDLLNTNKLNIEELLNSQFQSGLKMSSNNNFMNKSKRVLPKELFNYSTRKSKDSITNNIIPSNYKIFKEKHKTNIYLKNNSDSANDNNELANYKTNPIIKHNSNVFIIPNEQFFPRSNKNVHNANKKILLLKNDNYLNSLKDVDDYENKNNNKNNNNNLYLLDNNCIFGAGTEKKMISLSNKENTNQVNDSGNKLKRPTSCVNRKLEKYFTKTDKNKNFIKFANQGKKIYLKTNNKANKASIKIDEINNININYNIYTTKGNKKEQNKSNENENKENKNIYLHLNLHHPGNIMTDIFNINNSGELNLKTSKGVSFKCGNLCTDKEAKQKRFPSAMNNKAIKRNNKNILL